MSTDRCPRCDPVNKTTRHGDRRACACRHTTDDEAFCDCACHKTAHEVDWPARCRALAAALRGYGWHQNGCRTIRSAVHYWHDSDEAICTCGLGAALTGGGS